MPRDKKIEVRDAERLEWEDIKQVCLERLLARRPRRQAFVGKIYAPR